ncbi:protein of unknown function [endosymbiont DhMRE of Dentiscutata heterogama]|uniref:hypothetical protein n=1 Tax=endosymbiont DhMRE of Dentiscutata heterogama TaxID=1609546 RepID=UPI000629D47B|nr:hypothetical protein [endosymbiont DhMRE of Dentiscutata heterogama]CFW93308.1 protein of unknown function [endosymbiont DhMRE of Dentiscutata heterogama]
MNDTTYKNFKLLNSFEAEKGNRLRPCHGCGKYFADGEEVYRTEFDVFYDEGEYGVTESKGWVNLYCSDCFSTREGQELINHW